LKELQLRKCIGIDDSNSWGQQHGVHESPGQFYIESQ